MSSISQESPPRPSVIVPLRKVRSEDQPVLNNKIQEDQSGPFLQYSDQSQSPITRNEHGDPYSNLPVHNEVETTVDVPYTVFQTRSHHFTFYPNTAIESQSSPPHHFVNVDQFARLPTGHYKRYEHSENLAQTISNQIDVPCIQEVENTGPEDTAGKNLQDTGISPQESKKKPALKRRSKKSAGQANQSKICEVCGDLSKSFHFGAMCCDSCKAFFRRSVQGSKNSSFLCSQDSNCNIDKETRKNCQFCRFQKCLNVGMDTSLVMPETERINLWKSRISKYKDSPPKSKKPEKSKPSTSFKQHQSDVNIEHCSDNNDIESLGSHDSSNSFTYIPKGSCDRDLPQVSTTVNSSRFSNNSTDPDVSGSGIYISNSNGFRLGLPNGTKKYRQIFEPSTSSSVPVRHLSAADALYIDHLLELQKIAFLSTPYIKESFQGDSNESLVAVFYSQSQKLAAFFSRIEDLHILGKEDQKILLKNGIGMSLYIHGAYQYDTKLRIFPDAQCEPHLRIPNTVTLPTLRSFTAYPDIFDLLMSFYNLYAHLLKDEKLVTLLSIVALFSDDPHLIDLKTTTLLRSKYVTLMRDYLNDIIGEKECSALLQTFMQGIPFLRGIAANASRLPVAVQSFNSSSPLMYKPFDHQMVALSSLLESALSFNPPKYSSIFKSSHNIENILKKSNRSCHRKSKYTTRENTPYGQLTCSVFGRDNSTQNLEALTVLQNILAAQDPNYLMELASKAISNQ